MTDNIIGSSRMMGLKFLILTSFFLVGCSTSAIKKLDNLTGSGFYVEPVSNEVVNEVSKSAPQDSVANIKLMKSTVDNPSDNSNKSEEIVLDGNPEEFKEATKSSEPTVGIIKKPTKKELNELELLHYKVDFRVRSLKRLEDWNQFQVQVLENFESTLRWMKTALDDSDLSHDQIVQATTDIKRIKHSLLNLEDWKMTSQSPALEAKPQLSETKNLSEPVQELPDWETAHISWVGRFNELQNQARMGYTWKQLKADVAQIERSPKGASLAEPIQKLITSVQKRDRKEIVNLLFEIDMSLDSGKAQSAQTGITTLQHEYPDYLSEFPLVERESLLRKIQLNLGLPSTPNMLTGNSSLLGADLGESANSPNQAPSEVDEVKAIKMLAEADGLLEKSKWLEVRDLMRYLVNSQYRDQASSRIMTSSESYCTERRSQAAKYMARSRGRGKSRQSKMMTQALVELEKCAKEFPGSSQAEKVKDNIKMLKARI